MATNSYALVLRTFDYQEADQIAVVLTARFGKQRVFAKGSRKSKRRYAGGLGPFAVLDCELGVRDDGLGRLFKASVVQSWRELAEDLHKMAAGAYALELIDGVLEDGQGDAAFFETIQRFTSWLHAETRGPAWVEAGLHRLQLVLLVQGGWLPTFSRSARSGKPIDHFENPHWLPDQGLIDADERYPGESSLPLTMEVLVYLVERMAGRFPQRDERETRVQARDVLHRVFRHLLERELNSWPFYASMFGME